MAHFDERPYIKELEQIGPISVWLVDGPWTRKHLNKEFTNFAEGRNPRFKSFMPRDEFWIEEGSNPEEFDYFIDRMEAEWLALSRGLNFKRAEQAGNTIEQREREIAPRGERAILEHNPELRLLQQVGDVPIYLADGKCIRDQGKLRFCHGGHSEVYSWIPDNPDRIYIDSTSPQNDWPLITMHEFGEFSDMHNLGHPYKTAHPKWSRIEWKARWDPNELLRQQKQLGLI